MNDISDEDRWGPHGKPPSDVVPPRRWDRETLLAANAAVGKRVTQTLGGELIDDPDGFPLAVADPTITTGTFAVMVTRQTLIDAGVEPHEVPNLHIVEPKETP